MNIRTKTNPSHCELSEIKHGEAFIKDGMGHVRVVPCGVIHTMLINSEYRAYTTCVNANGLAILPLETKVQRATYEPIVLTPC